MDSMVPVPVNTTEEVRRIVREELHRRNRPASINCFETTQTLIRGAVTAVRWNINSQTVSSSTPAGNGSTSLSTATAFRSGIASPVNNNYQQSTTSSINEVWGPWRASGNKRRENPSHPGTYYYVVLLYISWLAIITVANWQIPKPWKFCKIV